MEEIKLIITISLIHMAAVMSPGPDFIMVVKNALSYSRKAGVYTALGIGSGIIIHILYTFLGLGLLIKETPELFNVIKYLGAAYIIYIGVMSFFSKPKKRDLVEADKYQSISNFKAFRIGFITNALNVKASIFFLGLFTTIITPNTSKETLIFLGFLIVFQTTLWFILVSYFFTNKLIQEKYYQFESLINKVFGLLLIGIAIKMIFF